MKLIFILVFIFSLNLLKLIENRVKIDFSYYHKTADINAMMTDMKGKCYPKMTEKSADMMFSDIDPKQKQLYSKLKYYDINKEDSPKSEQNTKGKEKINIFILAGEHPRELISTELILNFVKYLCLGNKDDKKYLDLVNSFNFRIILNANPIGREEVESGEYCKRTNKNNVDINRNWNIHWKLEEANPEEFGGESPFSEIETKFTKQLVDEFKPKLFLTIHSGAYGLFLPYAYLPEEGKKMYY
jgi:hypothetical protein